MRRRSRRAHRNVNHLLTKEADETIHDLVTHISDDELRIQIENAVSDVYAASYDAAYLFGACVGLEVAALTVCGQLPRTATARRGGRR